MNRVCQLRHTFISVTIFDLDLISLIALLLFFYFEYNILGKLNYIIHFLFYANFHPDHRTMNMTSNTI